MGKDQMCMRGSNLFDRRSELMENRPSALQRTVRVAKEIDKMVTDAVTTKNHPHTICYRSAKEAWFWVNESIR